MQNTRGMPSEVVIIRLHRSLPVFRTNLFFRRPTQRWFALSIKDRSTHNSVYAVQERRAQRIHECLESTILMCSSRTWQ